MQIGKSTKRALRRFQAETHMKRRLSEDRNQHRYEVDHKHLMLRNADGWAAALTNELCKDDPQWFIELSPICPCFYDAKVMARFKEQPKYDCHCMCCGYEKAAKKEPTLQEIKSDITFKEDLDEYYRDNISRLSVSG